MESVLIETFELSISWLQMSKYPIKMFLNAYPDFFIAF